MCKIRVPLNLRHYFPLALERHEILIIFSCKFIICFHVTHSKINNYINNVSYFNGSCLHFPGRLKHSTLLCEIVYSGSRLFELFNDFLIKGSLPQLSVHSADRLKVRCNVYIFSVVYMIRYVC